MARATTGDVSSSVPFNAGTQITGPQAPSAPALPGSDSGIWVAVALFGGIALSGTRVAPVVAGLLGVALIYQLQQLLQGK